MALAYNNTVRTDPLSSSLSSGTSLFSSLSPSAVANAKARGLLGGASLSPLVTTPSGAPSGGGLNKTPTNSTAAVGPVVSSPSAGGKSSIGSYKGVAISPGTDASIQAQIQQIDARDAAKSGAPASTASTAAGGTANNASYIGNTASASTAQVPTYGGVVGSLLGVGTGQNSQAVNDAINRLTNFRQAENKQTAAIYGEPGLASYKQGRAAAVQQANAQTENALATGVQNALTSQGQQIGALESAAGYTKPEQNYPFVFNPVTGTYTNASGGGVLNVDQAADLALNGQYNQALSGVSYLGPTATAQLQAAILKKNPNANIAQLEGQSAGQQSSAQTVAATPGTIQAGQSQSIAAYKSAQQQGQNLASQVNDLISTFGLNPSDLTAVNAGIQKIAQNTSSPQYQILSNYLNDIAARYSQILTPPGGTSTDTTRAVATGMLNSLASGTSIQQVLSSLDQQASAVIAGIPATGTVPNTSGGSSAGNAGSTGGTGSTGGNSSTTEGTSVSAGGYNFVYQNGQWVPA